MDPVRWGILGAAKFAREHMAPAIHAARHADFVALATSDRAKAAPFEAFRPGLAVHDSYEALLADPGIDAVYIPLPNHLHVDWALKAIEAGKHVLCEKPLGLRAEDFDPVIAARDRSGLVVSEGYMIVHHPQFARARELVQGGAIGRLVHVDTAFSFDNSADPGNIRNTRETGGGALPDIGVYVLGSVRFVTGQEPQDCDLAVIRWENGVDVQVRAGLRYEGFGQSLMVSMRAHPRQSVVFHGTDGVLTLPVPFNANVFGQAEVWLDRGTTREIERWAGVNHYVLQVEAFGRAIREGADWGCPLEFSRGTQVAMDMIYAAAGSAG